MVDVYGLIILVFGILGYFISGGSGVWLVISGIGVGVWLGVALLFQIRRGRLGVLVLWEFLTGEWE